MHIVFFYFKSVKVNKGLKWTASCKTQNMFDIFALLIIHVNALRFLLKTSRGMGVPFQHEAVYIFDFIRKQAIYQTD